jgi:hypothetical protein
MVWWSDEDGATPWSGEDAARWWFGERLPAGKMERLRDVAAMVSKGAGGRRWGALAWSGRRPTTACAASPQLRWGEDWNKFAIANPTFFLRDIANTMGGVGLGKLERRDYFLERSDFVLGF